MPEPRPRRIAPYPAITPAAGVIATRPIIIPYTAPIIDSFLKKIISITT